MTAASAPRVAAVYRYPVKSLTGEQTRHLDISARGVVGDRSWSVRTADGKIGSGKTTRRFAAVPGLLELRAAAVGNRVRVTFPDGTTTFVDDTDAAQRLSRYAGQQLTFAQETDVSHFDDGPVSLIGTASVDAVAAHRKQPVDAARFRPNILLDTVAAFAEDGWIGQRVTIGTAVLEVVMTSPRCVMVDMKTADLPAQPGNLLATGRVNAVCLGVIATVVVPGRVDVDDVVSVL